MNPRREFLKTAAAAATGAVCLSSVKAFSRPLSTEGSLFALHPFIENNPDAVFIMRTNVDVKTNASAVKAAGNSFAQSVFQLTDDENVGVPLDYYFPIKPNLTSWSWDAPKNVDFEKAMGIVTDANFVEGVIEQMKELGIAANHIHIRDANGAENIQLAGYGALAGRTGVDIQLSANNPKLQWKKVENGVWFNQIPYLWPINAPNSWLLNIAKFKAHGMGLTLCCKNLQGTIAAPYVGHCTSWGASMGINSSHIQPNAFSNIKTNYERHRDAGVPRWDKSGTDFQSGLGMETWASRCLDNNSTLKPGLNVIEAIYGRDGNGFYKGPHDGIAQDFMTNMIIFGKNSVYVDIVGKWLGGHEPGNFGLFHLAKERGLIDTFNPHDISLFEWDENSSATSVQLKDFTRTDLLTYYIPRAGEDKWHMCNEPYDYASSDVENNEVPADFTLEQNYPNPFNGRTAIQFNLAKNKHVNLTIYNMLGKKVKTLADSQFAQGTHEFNWDGRNKAGQLVSSGTYLCSLRSGSVQKTIQMTFVQ